MFAKLIKTTLTALIPYVPSIVKGVKNHFSMEEAEKKIRAKMKERDNIPFTKEMYDIATKTYEQTLLTNKDRPYKDRITLLDLTATLNDIFHTNKGVTSMIKLCKGEYLRVDLPKGEPLITSAVAVQLRRKEEYNK